MTDRAAEIPVWLEPVTNFGRDWPFGVFFVLIVLSWLAAWLVDRVLTRAARRLVQQTRTELDDEILAALHGPIKTSVFLFGLGLAVRSLLLPIEFDRPVLRILGSIVILVWLLAGFPILSAIIDALGRNKDRFAVIEERTIPLFSTVSKLALVGGAVYFGLLVWGINPTAWLASAGVIGIAVGFAAKDSLANLFGGFFILADGPYKLGDFIVLDSGERGRVTHVGIRSTRLMTRDDIEITLPNAIIANSKITNESGGPSEHERIRIKVGVGYDSDVDQVVEVLERLAIEHEHVRTDPAPRVRMRAFGDSSLDFELLCWIDEPILRGRLIHEILMEIHRTFNREGIEIPFPRRDVYLHEATK